MTESVPDLFVPLVRRTDWRPDLRLVPPGPTTRFAPAPTGDLHLGHLVNAIYTWGVARATDGRVVLRIEDHDRQRSRPEFEALLLGDLERLRLVPDEPPIAAFRGGRTPYRQSDADESYREALEGLRAEGRVYACACTRTTYQRYESQVGRAWRGPGCPGGCRGLGIPADDAATRVALGAGSESWIDALAGPVAADPSAAGDLLIRDRLGNWTYAFCVVVDDLRQGIDLVVRGRDLLDATASQIRLGRLLGRERPPVFLHHPLVRKTSGEKLSKAAGDVAVRTLLDAGRSAAELLGLAARLAGIVDEERPIEPEALGDLFR